MDSPFYENFFCLEAKAKEFVEEIELAICWLAKHRKIKRLSMADVEYR